MFILNYLHVVPITKDISLFTRRFSFADLSPGDERIWHIIQPSLDVSQPTVRTLKPTPFILPDNLVDLLFILPTSYQGPEISIDGLVRTLGSVRLVQSSLPLQSTNAPGNPTSKPRIRRHESVKNSGGGKSRKRVKRRLSIDGGAKIAPFIVRPPVDLFEQRFLDREAAKRQ